MYLFLKLKKAGANLKKELFSSKWKSFQLFSNKIKEILNSNDILNYKFNYKSNVFKVFIKGNCDLLNMS